MATTLAPTAVVYRRFKATHQVIALLPHVRPGYGLCQAYTAGGQGLVVDYFQTLRDTVPASGLLQMDVRALMLDLVSLPERYQLQTVTAETVHVERAGVGQQMSFLVEAASAPATQYALQAAA
jgi:hypothetical protein